MPMPAISLRNNGESWKDYLSRTVYSPVKPFLPYFLRPDDLAGTATGEYKPDVFDAIDLIPSGKAAALAGKLAPAAAMVINPKTVGKFKVLYEEALKSLHKDPKTLGIYPELSDSYRKAIAFLKVRHPRLYKSITKFGRDTKYGGLAEYYPNTKELHIDPLEAITMKTTPSVDTIGHEFTHHGQTLRRLPGSVTDIVDVPDPDLVDINPIIYDFSPYELEANILGGKKLKEYLYAFGGNTFLSGSKAARAQNLYKQLSKKVLERRRMLPHGGIPVGTKISPDDWAIQFKTLLDNPDLMDDFVTQIMQHYK